MLIPASKEAVWLLHEGVRALSRAEHAGIRIDTDRLHKTTDKVSNRIKTIKQRIKEDEVYKVWRKRYGPDTNLNSRTQLHEVLFSSMGLEKPVTDGGKMDKEVLERVDHPFVKHYLEVAKLDKLHGTYLKGVHKHVSPDGFLRPSFALHTVITYRGSCLDPNFQNIPIRDLMVGKLIRRCFIARDGFQLLENDFKGAEVCTAVCYHKDPTMIRYLETGHDMHKDMAAACYKLPKDKVPKNVRQTAKALFVFAEFYGSYYIDVARTLWEAAETQGLKTEDGLGLREHLAKKGIRELGACDPKKKPVRGTFEHHIKRVEDEFWNITFPKYKAWKEAWWAEYLQKGWFHTLTGFTCQGVFKRNQVVNSPIQGSAFHCLLWSLIRVSKLLAKYKMKTKIVGQIHDSIISDVYQKELDDYLGIVMQVVSQDLPKAWPWIITRMQIEAELCPPGGSWYDKQEIQLAA